MPISRNRLYAILIVACTAGYVWLFLNISDSSIKNTDEIEVCLIKQITDIPCPSCGSTRSVLAIFNGEFSQAFFWNPLGFILLIVLFLTPVWISYDCLSNNNSLLLFYNKIETTLKQKKIAIPAILLILANWLWNIHKGL